jgi:Zn-dependent peptidase ImmA (M78 family)
MNPLTRAGAILATFTPTREQAEIEAERIIESEWEGRGLPIDPVYIARQLGVHVYDMPLVEGVDGMLKFYRAGSFPAILVAEGAQPNRRRFSIAHELGHFVMYLRRDPAQDDVPETDVFYRNQDSRTAKKPEEVFANQFGAALLMPRRFVRALVEDGKNDLVLARYFEVSLEAMTNRLKNLGLSRALTV